MPLPNFLIIGANKAGTTSLHSYLAQHPQIVMSRIKEPAFFIYDRIDILPNSDAERIVLAGAVNNLGAYEELFENRPGVIAFGEASTAYLANPSCAEYISRVLPEVRIITVLRHPIDRAFSNYRMYRRWGIEKRTFSRAIRDEISGKVEHLPQGQRYLELGCYSAPLSHFLEVFGTDHVKIFLFDDLISRPKDLLEEVCEFLGVSEGFRFSTDTVHNSDGSRLSIPTLWGRIYKKDVLTREDRVLLTDFFAEDIRSLEQLLQWDLGEWKVRHRQGPRKRFGPKRK